MAKELWFIRMEEFTKAIGKMISEKGKVMKSTLMEIVMKEIILKVDQKVKEYIIGLIMKLMKENGIRV